MYTGRIQKILFKKGYGFILGDNNKSYFFHFSALGEDITPKNIYLGQYVYYDLMDSIKGKMCVNIQKYSTYDDYDSDDYDSDDYDDNLNNCNCPSVWYDSNVRCGRCGSYRSIEKNGYFKCLDCGNEGY
ncbi:cold-shock protein [Aliarcobacter butzleri]|uniref:cold-shock protein n=1 Tax=Aliarcobacter butzleri TaxID=28197 RepID=UPI0024DE3C65|nr:cold shock domain-containing protein [Aliarcobacter butzleri]MDK2080130.1 cold shock domain-containing protein [Aliarcobacter butzleri]